MAATREEISSWFDRGIAAKATHMIVVCDTYDHEEYPVFVLPGSDAMQMKLSYDAANMQQVMEVYNLSMSKEDQLKEPRAFNY